MNETLRTTIPLAAVLLAAFFSPLTSEGGQAADPLYDESADGAVLIADALALAKAENKRVLVQFGANWCVWCHRLDQLFQSDESIAAELESSYVVVLIDVDGDHNENVEDRYGNPTQYGLPVLIVLDADGQLLTTQETGALEDGPGHDPAKVMAFLKQWAAAGPE